MSDNTPVKVKILVPGMYRKIEQEVGSTQTHVNAEFLEIGDERIYDRFYATVLQDNELVEILGVASDPIVEDTEDLTEETVQDTNDAPNASQNAINLAEENDIDLSLITGTGPDGKVTIKNVNDYIKSQEEIDLEGKLAELKKEVDEQLEAEAKLAEGE